MVLGLQNKDLKLITENLLNLGFLEVSELDEDEDEEDDEAAAR